MEEGLPGQDFWKQELTHVPDIALYSWHHFSQAYTRTAAPISTTFAKPSSAAALTFNDVMRIAICIVADSLLPLDTEHEHCFYRTVPGSRTTY